MTKVDPCCILSGTNVRRIPASPTSEFYQARPAQTVLLVRTYCTRVHLAVTSLAETQKIGRTVFSSHPIVIMYMYFTTPLGFDYKPYISPITDVIMNMWGKESPQYDKNRWRNGSVAAGVHGDGQVVVSSYYLECIIQARQWVRRHQIIKK
jgi:hypothetical protein